MDSEKTPKTKDELELKKTQKDDRDFETLLAELGEGRKIQIMRIEPRWCDGILATEEQDPDYPISLEDIRERFGGRKLRIRLQNHLGQWSKSATLKFPDPPKEHGRILKSPAEIEEERERLKWANPPKTENSKNELETLNTFFDKILSIQAANQAAIERTLQNQIDNLQNQLSAVQRPQSDNNNDPLAAVRAATKTFAEIKKMQESMGLSENVENNESGGMGFLQAGLQQIIGLEIEKQKLKLEQTKRQAQPPALPERKPQSEVTDEDLSFAKMVKEQMANVTPEQLETIQAILSGEIELLQDDDNEPKNVLQSEKQNSEDNETVKSSGNVEGLETLRL